MYTLALLKICFLKHIKTIKFWIPFIIAFSAVNNVAAPICKMTSEYQTPINAFSAAFLFSDKYVTFIMFLGVFVLLTDLPMKDNQQFLLLVRSGKMPWVFNQLLYIVLVVFTYFIFTLVSLYILLSPYLAFDASNWGKVVNTISGTNAYSVFNMRLHMPQNVITDYSPLEAFGYSVGMAIFIAVVLGWLMFTLNLVSKTKLGTFVTGVIIFMYLFISDVNAIDVRMYYFSPIGWCSLSLMDKNSTSIMPDFSYAVIVLLIVMFAALTISFFYGNKRSKFSL